MYKHLFSVSVYSPLYLTTNTKKSRLFSDACVKMNILDPFRRFLFTHLDFCPFSVDKCNATVEIISSKMEKISWLNCPDDNTNIKNGRSFKKYSKFTPKIHINPNSYSFRIIFIMIIVRSFIICFING